MLMANEPVENSWKKNNCFVVMEKVGDEQQQPQKQRQ
jgi:hypothetical protein